METKASSCCSSSCSCSHVFTKELVELCSLAVSAATHALFYALFTLIFAIGGAVVGSIMGVFSGLKSCRNIIFWAFFGAIKGGLFSTDICKFSFLLWQFDDRESAISSSLNLIEGVINILSRRFDHELLSMFIPSLLEYQEDSATKLFDIVPGDYSEESWITVNKISNNKTIKDKVTKAAPLYKPFCSVCLQDIQVRDKTRRSLKCRHIFHSTCINKWLCKHKTCPLCRELSN